MKKNLLIYLICINMLCFAIWNLPIYKYLCGLSVTIIHNYARVMVSDFNSITNPLIGSYPTGIATFSGTENIHTFFLLPTCQIYNELKNLQTNQVFELYLHTTLVNSTHIDFFALQDKLYILQFETNLIFFRMYNANHYSVFGITIYMISPIEYWFCINKIQCFCFEKILIHAHECIDLPVLFFFSNNTNGTTQGTLQGAVIINYIFFPYTYSSMAEQL